MPALALCLIFASILLAGGVFGFFYAWSVTMMRGLSLAEGVSAIGVMQSVNANIMTGWFALIFFGTPMVTATAALVAWLAGGRSAALWLVAATATYLLGCFAVTVIVNVPMNEALAELDPQRIGDPAAAWSAYSGPWTAWNHVRTAACGLTLLCAAAALWRCPA
jgi:uncharacterized membrane protein